MKLTGRKVIKSPEKENVTQKTLPQEKEIKPIEPPIQAPHTFRDNESFKKSSVFVSGWKSQDIKKEDAQQETIKEKTPYVRPASERLPRDPQIRKKSRILRKPILGAFIVVILLCGLYFIAGLFEKTTINIKEKEKSFTIDHAKFTALKNSRAPINFEVMIVSDSESKDIVLTESENVSTKAKGVVTLYNENSTKPQNLLINTMLSDENGKAYQTDKAVTIPGYTMDKGKMIPGQISVDITAFLPGDSYNGTPKDFTINGFKGTDKFKKVYAKATTPVSGGAQGLVYILGAEDQGSLNATASSTFKNRLLKKVNAEVPEGYILYPQASSFSYTIGGAQSSTPNAKVGIDGVLTTIIFKESDLSDAVTKSVLPDLPDEEYKEIKIPNISELSFNFINGDQSITKDMESVQFALTGNVDTIWHPDIGALKSQLLGVHKKDLPSLFKSDPGIAEANARLFPPWNKYLPTDEGKIQIYVD